MRFFLLTALVCLLLVNVVFSLNKRRDCKCRIQANRRIIGGRDAPPMAWPWQITQSHKEPNPLPDNLRRLVPDSRKTRYHSCGGSIINERFILSAAHCVKATSGTINPAEWEIGYGDNDLARIYNLKQYKPIKAIHMHPDYSSRSITNDIALIELAEPLKFSDSVQPACLGFEKTQLYDGVLKVSGWGRTKPVYEDPKTGEITTSPKPRFLKDANVYDHSDQKSCDHEQNICLENEFTKDTVCVGDSGGPIHHTKNGKSLVVGIASFVNVVKEDSKLKSCAGKMSFTRLSTFKAWVESKIGQEYCP